MFQEHNERTNGHAHLEHLAMTRATILVISVVHAWAVTTVELWVRRSRRGCVMPDTTVGGTPTFLPQTRATTLTFARKVSVLCY